MTITCATQYELILVIKFASFGGSLGCSLEQLAKICNLCNLRSWHWQVENNKIPWRNWSELWFRCRRSHRWCYRWRVSCSLCLCTRRKQLVSCLWLLDWTCCCFLRQLNLEWIPRELHLPLFLPSEVTFLQNRRTCLRKVYPNIVTHAKTTEWLFVQKCVKIKKKVMTCLSGWVMVLALFALDRTVC